MFVKNKQSTRGENNEKTCFLTYLIYFNLCNFYCIPILGLLIALWALTWKFTTVFSVPLKIGSVYRSGTRPPVTKIARREAALSTNSTEGTPSAMQSLLVMNFKALKRKTNTNPDLIQNASPDPNARIQKLHGNTTKKVTYSYYKKSFAGVSRSGWARSTC